VLDGVGQLANVARPVVRLQGHGRPDLCIACCGIRRYTRPFWT
jgi:hypothetical protein